MKPKPKIAIYSGEIPSTTFIERLIIGLSNKGCEVFLFGRINKNVSYNQNVLIRGYKSGKLQKGLYVIYYSLLLLIFRSKDKRKLDQILKSQSRTNLYDKVKCYPVLWYKPDIFHIQWAKGLSEWMWLHAFDVKLVLSLRGAHINYSPIADSKLAALYKKQFPNIDAFHAVSKAIAKEATKYNAVEEKIKVIYSGLDITPNTTLEKRNNNIFKIVSIGRSHWKKGYTYALDACKIMKDNDFKFEYTIIGAADNIEYTYQIHDLNLVNDVKVLGQTPFAEVKEIMQNADLLLLPSVEEGIANVVLEAMALKTIVLTTNCGGMDEVIKDGENGFIIPIRDSQIMANKIIEIAHITKLKKDSVIFNALETMKKQHGEEQMVDAMIELYQGV